MTDILISILSGGAVVAVIEGIREALSWHRKRKAEKEDRLEENKKLKLVDDAEWRERVDTSLDDVKSALKYVLYDRIRYLGQAYISEREIDFDDRRILNDMHKSYHCGLGGNGDLDVLMESVNKLPLKPRGG